MSLPDNPTAALLFRFNQNVNALGSAVDEIRIWIEQRGSTETSASIRSYLSILEANADSIAEGMGDVILICAERGNEVPTAD